MAELYGRIQGNRGEATRCGSRDMDTSAETWNGSVKVHLRRGGDFTVRVGDKRGGRTAITGNVDKLPTEVALHGTFARTAAQRVLTALEDVVGLQGDDRALEALVAALEADPTLDRELKASA